AARASLNPDPYACSSRRSNWRTGTFDVALILRGFSVELIDPVAENPSLHLHPSVEPGVRVCRGLALERQRDASTLEYLVRDVEEVEHFGHADIGDSLIHDLLNLDRRDADVEGPAQHDFVLVDCLASDDGPQLHHESRPCVESPVGQHFAEGPVVEDCDQLWVSYFECRLVIGEQRVVIALRFLTDGHGEILLDDSSGAFTFTHLLTRAARCAG